MLPESACTDTTKATPPTPAPPSGEAYESTPRYYNLLIPSQMAIPYNYERGEDNDEKYDKFKGGDILSQKAG